MLSPGPLVRSQFSLLYRGDSLSPLFEVHWTALFFFFTIMSMTGCGTI